MNRRTNEEWIADLKAGGLRQEEALADLHKLILDGLPYALSRWLPPEDPRFSPFAEEVAQDSLLRVLQRMDSFEGRSQFTTWVHTIAVRVALSELRRMKWQEVSLDALLDGPEQEESSHQIEEKGAGIEVVAERDVLLGLLQKIIAEELTEKQRKALVAIAIQGMPMEEVAQQMGMERNALYKLLHDARLSMKKSLLKKGISTSEVLSVFEEG